MLKAEREGLKGKSWNEANLSSEIYLVTVQRISPGQTNDHNELYEYNHQNGLNEPLAFLSFELSALSFQLLWRATRCTQPEI